MYLGIMVVLFIIVVLTQRLQYDKTYTVACRTGQGWHSDRFCKLLVPFELYNIGKPLHIRSWRMEITTEYILCHILRIGCIIRTVLGKFTFNQLTMIRFR